MGFLNDLASNKVTQDTTMPTWYDQAQQNVVNKAASGAGAVPTLQNTVAGNAINQLNSQQNPFTQAQGTLNQIATGAANPWITSPTGTVTPNTNTALGGLFAAQNQQLQQTLPNVTAPVQGANIASGNFGSLRGETAIDKAKADALSALNTSQMQTALQNQSTGVNAAIGQGNVGSQGVTSMVNLGQAQQADPLLAASGLGKIVAGIQSPTTVTSQTQLSPLNLAGTLLSATNGSIAGVSKLLDSMGIKGGLSALTKGIGSLFGIGGDDKVYPLDGGGQVILKPDGTKIITNPQGQTSVIDKNGNPIGKSYDYKPTTGGTTPTKPGGLPSTGGTTPKPGGGGTTGGGLDNGSGMSVDENGKLTTGTFPTADGGTITINQDGTMVITDPNGTSQVFDADGQRIDSGYDVTNPGDVSPGDSLSPGEEIVPDNTQTADSGYVDDSSQVADSGYYSDEGYA